MKRFFTLLLTVCMCLSVVAGFAACKKEHVHSYSPLWSKDDEYHWHDCEGDCNTYIERASHVWSDPVVTREADEEAPGIRHYRCTVCGKEKDEEFPFDDSQGPTTTMLQEQMERAFDVSAFKNVTMTYYEANSGKFKRKIVYMITEEGLYWYRTDEDGTVFGEQYDIETDSGYDVYTKNEDGEWCVESVSKFQYSLTHNDPAAQFAARYSRFSENYEKFEYKLEDKAYHPRDAATKIGNDTVTYAKICFEAKKLISLAFLRPISDTLDFIDEGGFGNYQEFTFENYGKTSFEKPTDAIRVN